VHGTVYEKPAAAPALHDSAYADLADVPVDVRMLVEPYVNVPSTTATGEPPPAYESRPELKALFAFLRRVKAIGESEITDSPAIIQITLS
jgi:hypothetical protein